MNELPPVFNCFYFCEILICSLDSILLFVFFFLGRQRIDFLLTRSAIPFQVEKSFLLTAIPSGILSFNFVSHQRSDRDITPFHHGVLHSGPNGCGSSAG